MSAFPPGPWDHEPDEQTWTDEATGLTCCVYRVPFLGHLCGYVQIPEGHPCHGVDRGRVRVEQTDPDDEWTARPDVHGDLTFGGQRASVDGWWLGFDCAHHGDLTPALTPSFWDGSVYRDFAWVKQHTTALAGQLASALPEPPNREEASNDDA